MKILKNILAPVLLMLVLFTLSACTNSKKEEHYNADYNASSLETAIKNGENVAEKTVVFKVNETKHHTILGGYSLYAGEKLDFKSKEDPKVSKDDLLIVKVDSIDGETISYSGMKKIKKLSDVTVKNDKLENQAIKLDVEDNLTADSKGSVTIKGKTLPKAKVSIKQFLKDITTEADSQGDFSLKLNLKDYDTEQNIKLQASLLEKTISKNLTVKQNPTIISSHEAEISKSEASSQAEASKEEAESKAKEADDKSKQDATKKESTTQSVPAIETTYTDFYNKLGEMSFNNGETYKFSATVIPKSPGSAAAKHDIAEHGQQVYLGNPDKDNEVMPFYANPNDFLGKGSLVTVTVKTVLWNTSDGDTAIDLVITSVNGKESDAVYTK